MPLAAPAPPASQIDPQDYRFLQDYVYRESGIVLDGDKQYLLEARLMPVIRQHQLASLQDLCALLRATANPPLKRQVVEAMTTHETFFFRDMAHYEALRTVILPELLQQRQDTRKLSFWSAAASFGQEAYSLALMLIEMGLQGWNIRILGTDLSSKAVERAREARYMQIEVNRGLPAQYLVRYFTRAGLDWQLKDDVRRMAQFEVRDLRQSLRTMGPFDVVFCRNVLIYFDVECKKKILAELRGTLFHGGHLLLGGSETTLNLDNSFERRTIGSTVVYRAP